MKNLLYLGYFIKKTDWKQFLSQISYVSNKYNISKFHLFSDMLFSTLIRGNSFHEYYYYAFYSKKKEERDAYATMGFMYEFQKRFNPVQQRDVLENKIKFFEIYSEFIGRKWMKILECSEEDIEIFISEKEKIVLKNSLSGGGKAVRIYSMAEFNAKSLKGEALKNNFDIAEEFVYQHHSLQKLSPNSLNTVRLVTQYTKDNTVEIIGAMIRFGILKQTDNLSSGGIACTIDINSGKIESNGVTFEISQNDYVTHPVSKQPLIGFQIPYWQDSIDICKAAAIINTENKTIGWDVAITENAPILIEANNDWGARVWQMPAKKGLKYKLNKYIQD